MISKPLCICMNSSHALCTHYYGGLGHLHARFMGIWALFYLPILELIVKTVVLLLVQRWDPRWAIDQETNSKAAKANT